MDLKPGEELKIVEYFHRAAGSLDISDLIQFSMAELEKMEQDSISEEKKIYDEIRETVYKWKEQATQTVRTRHAKKFLQSRAAEHTANQWTKDESGWNEKSNMVYRMTYRISEGVQWNNRKGKNMPFCKLSWSVTYNTPKNPDNGKYHKKIAGQEDKKFPDKLSLEKYLQGRIAAYAHLFTEISPPIPVEYQKCFCINGVLLSGYTVENPDAMKPDEAAVDKLLALLGDDELVSDITAPAHQPEEKSPQEIWAKHRKQRPGPSQRRSAPAR